MGLQLPEWRTWVLALLLGTGCASDGGTGAGTGATSGSSGASVASSSGSESVGPPLSSSSTSGTGTGSGSESTDATSGSSSTGLVFPDPCDTFEQDCPDGYKCNPSSNDGNLALDWTRCVPVTIEPDAVGEPCTWETDSQSGLDSCEVGAACHNRDWFARSGHCLELCGGTAENPTCRDEADRCFVSMSTSLHSCLTPCSLETATCRRHERCVPTLSDGLHCVALAEGRSELGDACVDPAQCAEGLFCGPSAPSLCGEDSELCCLPLCEVNAPDCPHELVCAPWYSDPPEGSEQLGVCQDAG